MNSMSFLEYGEEGQTDRQTDWLTDKQNRQQAIKNIQINIFKEG